MSNTIQKYVNNKLCCLSTAVHNSDTKFQYGVDDYACCVKNDFIANVFFELLACNPVPSDAKWYKSVSCTTWTEKIPAEYNFSDPLNMLDPGSYFVSNDGYQQVLASIEGNYGVLADMTEVGMAFTDIIHQQGQNTGNPSIYWTAEYNTTDGCTELSIYHDDTWGDLTNRISSVEVVPSFSIPFNRSSVESSYTEVSINNCSCFTLEELCSIKTWLDKYCQSCSV